MKNKLIIYQVFTRLFGNDKTSCIRDGAKEENGCGHFADFTQKALNEILASNTGQSIKKIEKDTDRDYIMTPQEALEYGMIDKVISRDIVK